MRRSGASPPAGPGASWRVVERTGSVRALHAVAVGPRPGRAIWVMRPVGEAVVLGSGQRPDTVDAAAARRRDLPILRRRSGGGAVLVSPADLLWVDVVVPRDDPLWHPDAAGAFAWLGRAWQRALAECGISGEVYEGAYEAGRWGKLVCYAGRGPGEVFVAGRKVVGLSQRRSRAYARFQSGLLRRWEPGEFAALLALSAPEREALAQDLAGSAAPVTVAEDRMLAALYAAVTATRGATAASQSSSVL